MVVVKKYHCTEARIYRRGWVQFKYARTRNKVGMQTVIFYYCLNCINHDEYVSVVIIPRYFIYLTVRILLIILIKVRILP